MITQKLIKVKTDSFLPMDQLCSRKMKQLGLNITVILSLHFFCGVFMAKSCEITSKATMMSWILRLIKHLLNAIMFCQVFSSCLLSFHLYTTWISFEYKPVLTHQHGTICYQYQVTWSLTSDYAMRYWQIFASLISKFVSCPSQLLDFVPHFIT